MVGLTNSRNSGGRDRSNKETTALRCFEPGRWNIAVNFLDGLTASRGIVVHLVHA
jgi:hypothetical protein